jgi:hypothetical protein
MQKFKVNVCVCINATIMMPKALLAQLMQAPVHQHLEITLQLGLQQSLLPHVTPNDSTQTSS